MQVVNQVPGGKISISLNKSPSADADIGTGKTEIPSFADMLRESIDKTNLLQYGADMLNKNLALGKAEVEDLHQVVLAGEKAELSLLLTVQIRNKVIEAYQELMRMQV